MNYNFLRLTIIAAASVLLQPAGAAIIRVEGDRVILSNDAGCKLVIDKKDGGYGLGTFYFNNVALGAPIDRFLMEENVGNNAANTYQQVWRGNWAPGFRATAFEIVENGPERGVIRFSGKDSNPTGSVTIALARGATGYRIDYELLAVKNIKHPLSAPAPFFADKMQFVQFPFENPLVPPFRKRWTIQPTRSTVPLMFGAQKIDGRDYYVGIGYRLDQDYQRGALEYDGEEAAPFRLRFLSPHLSGWLGRPAPGATPEPYRLSTVICTAATQYDCVAGYRAESGYDISTPIRRGLDASIAGIMRMYKNSSAYVSLPPYKNKAYHQQIQPETGKPPEKGYGSYIPIGVNVQLAYQFYRYWESHRDEAWARDRALQMVGFFLETQNAHGAVPTLWDPKARRFRAYNQVLDQKEYFYATCQQAMGAYSLYRLYLERKAVENITEDSWKDAALRAMDDLVGKVRPDGFLGRNYDEKGNFDDGCAPDWALVALDYFAAETREPRYIAARERLEQWAYDKFIRSNHYFGWSSDGGNWRGQTAPPWNVDALNSMSLASYSALRHMRTGDPKYLDWAKTVMSYNWLVAIPIQFPEYKHVTKALVREQDFYVTYDLPFRTCLYVDGLPYLSALTGDRFFMDFYRLMIQTQMAYQNEPPRFQSFNIGLWWDESGANPSDKIGEADVNYIVEFCSLFLESVTSPYAYRYVGGPGWGQGLDYDLPFKPAFEKQGPWVIGSTGAVTNATWTSGTNTLKASLNGHAGSQGTFVVGWEPGRYAHEKIHVLVDGKPAGVRHEKQNGREVLSVQYSQAGDRAAIEISF